MFAIGVTAFGAGLAAGAAVTWLVPPLGDWRNIPVFGQPTEEPAQTSVEIDLGAVRGWPPTASDLAIQPDVMSKAATPDTVVEAALETPPPGAQPWQGAVIDALPDLLPGGSDGMPLQEARLSHFPEGDPPEPSDRAIDQGDALPALAPPMLDQLEMSEAGEGQLAEPERDKLDETVVVKAGDTLFNILTRVGVNRAEAQEVVDSLSELYDPRRLRPGQELGVAFLDSEAEAAAQRLVSLSLAVDVANDVVLARDANGAFSAQMIERALSRDTSYGAGAIEGSLYETAQRNGVPLDAVAALVKLFSWDVDFQRDIHPGDSFETIYARLLNDKGEIVRSDELLFAALEMRGRTLTAYRFERSDGTVDYYDADGRAIRKWLLKTPIDGARLSSRFGPRKHPILGYTRMHKGIDFAAPTGTPIFAAGDATVDFAGRNKGYGKYIRLKHSNEYSTAYGHLSDFKDGLKKGSRVRQGDVIGYVGSTGMATGPHLHYEILRVGEQINPLDVKQVVAGELAGEELTRFRAFRDRIDRDRGAFESEQLVAQRVETN